MTVHAPPVMAACYLTGIGSLELRSVSVPQPGPAQVLVRVSSVGICGSDLHFLREGRVGIEVITEPLVLGHECSGVIAAVGAGVDSGRIGSRVSLEPQMPCRRCRECKRGAYNLCPSVAFFGALPQGGALTEYVLLDSDFAHDIGPSISDDAAALIEPFSIGLSAIRKAGMRGGDSVLVAGAGPIGVVTMLAARALGAGWVVMTDPVETRRASALSLGASEALDPRDLPAVPQFDSFVDCSGSEVAVLSGMAALLPGGSAVLVGVGADRLAIDPDLVRRRELIVTGVFRSANCWPDIIALMESGALALDPLVSRRFPLADHQLAFAAAGGADVVKVIVNVRQDN